MSTPRCIAANIFRWIAPTVLDAGVCPTSDAAKVKILDQMNLIQEAIMTRIDTEGMLYDFPVPVRSGCFALPIDCESDRNIFVNGFPAIQRDQWYEGKLAWGRNNMGVDCRLQCIDQGQFAIPLQLPKVHGIRIALVAESNGDAGQVVTLEIINPHGDRVTEQVTLVGNGQPALTNTIAYDVTMFNKPQTHGVVQAQIRYDDGTRFPLARYPAKCEHGYFRRKKLPVKMWGCNEVVIKGKLKAYDLTDENDVVPFANRMAWRFGAQAISANTRGENEFYEQNLSMALRELCRSMQDSDPSGNQANMKFRSGFATSRSYASGGRDWN